MKNKPTFHSLSHFYHLESVKFVWLVLSSIFTWILGVRFSSPGLQDRHLYQLSHFPGPHLQFFLKDIFAGYRILNWQSFSFRHFEEMIPLFLGFIASFCISLLSGILLHQILSSAPSNLMVAIGKSTFDCYDGQELMASNTSTKKINKQFKIYFSSFPSFLPPALSFAWCWKLNLGSHTH